MQIIAFDPGYSRLGWGVINADLSSGSLELVDFGVIETDAKQDASKRMYTLYTAVSDLLSSTANVKIKPDHVAMEKLYFSKNKKTAAGVYQAQGIILSAVGKTGLPIEIMEPKVIKHTLSGSGNASKQQLMTITCRLLNRSTAIHPDDASDAVAGAIATYFRLRSKNKLTEAIL